MEKLKIIIGLIIASICGMLMLIVINGQKNKKERIMFSPNNENYEKICEYLENNMDTHANENDWLNVYSFNLLDYSGEYIYIMAYNFQYINNNKSQKSEWINPVRLCYEYQDDVLIITDSTCPRDGAFYAEDCRSIFPSSLHDKVISVDLSEDEKILLKERAKERIKEK